MSLAVGLVQNKTKLGLLCLLTLCVFAKDRGFKIPISVAKKMLSKDKFDMYPWGRLTFKHLIDSVKTADFDKHRLVIYVFVQVLQVWGYWAFHRLGEMAGNKIICEGVELTQWKGCRKQYDLDQLLMDDMIEHGVRRFRDYEIV